MDLVLSWLRNHAVSGGELLDVGCGNGSLLHATRELFDRYVGVDILRHDAFPAEAAFVQVDLDSGTIPLPDEGADVITCLETIEHVENPRALVRELVRLVRPGGWLLVTTPNQLSLASKLCLLLKNEFLHFQDRPGLYPAHITALLEVDLRRMFQECGLCEITASYSGRGRIPLTARHWPGLLAKRSGPLATALSDNLLVSGRKPMKPA